VKIIIPNLTHGEMLFNPIFHFSVELKFAKHANACTQSVFFLFFCQCCCLIIRNCLKVRIVGTCFGGGVVRALVVLVAVSLLWRWH